MSQDAEIGISLPASILRHPFTNLSGVSELLIRPLVVEDAAAVVEAIMESSAELRKFMPFAHFTQTEEIQRQRIARAYQSYWLGQDFTFGIFASPSGRFLGGTGLHSRALNDKALEIGYWVRSSAARNGVCTLATRCLIVYGFAYLGLERIQCGFDTQNDKSKLINDKCGFVREGVLENFLESGTPEWKANGWLGCGDMEMRRILANETHALSWYDSVAQSLKVFDWRGRLAKPR